MPAPRGLVQQVDQLLHRRPLLKPEMRLLVACSGGADSVALLRLLHAINGSAHWNWHLVVGHVNHGLRGKASDGDAAFVRQLAKSLKLKVAVARIRMAGASEAEARHKRFAALQAMVRKYRLDGIVTAHHLDDQAETILLRLIRGCGVRGASGMARRTRVGGLLVLRPLLDIPGAALRQYLQQIAQPWREDATNVSRQYRRNIIRHDVLPVLKRINPDVATGLARFATHCRQSAQAIERQAARAAGKAARGRGVICFSRAQLRHKPPAVRGVMLRSALVELGGRADQIDFDQMQALIRAIAARPSGLVFMFGGGVAVNVQRDVVEVHKKHPARRLKPR